MESLAGNLLITIGGFVGLIFFLMLLSRGDIVYGVIVYLFSAIFLGKSFFFISLPGLPDIYLERIIFVFLFMAVVVELVTGRERTLPNTSIEYWMAVLLLTLMVSMYRTGFVATRGDEVQPFHIFLTGFLFPFSFYYFGKTFIYTENRLRILLWTSFVLLTYLVLTAYFEHFKINSLIYPKYIADPTEGIHYGRARGPFAVAPVDGWVMATLFFSSLFLRTQIEGIFIRGIILWVLLLTPGAIFYTYTRAVWLSFILAPVVTIIFSPRLLVRARFFLIPLVVIFLLVMLNWQNITGKERELGGVMQLSEIEARKNLFEVTKSIFPDYPLFGVGFGRFTRALPFYAGGIFFGTSAQIAAQHNIFFSLLSEVGIIGIIPFLLILYYAFLYSIRFFKELGLEGFFNRDLMVVFWAMMVIYIVNASFIQTQFFLSANVLVFLWIGIAVGFYQRKILDLLPLESNP